MAGLICRAGHEHWVWTSYQREDYSQQGRKRASEVDQLSEGGLSSARLERASGVDRLS